MWLLAWEFLLIKSVLHFSFLHLLSGYYYYDYVVIGVLRPLWFTEILFWIALLLSKEVKQLKIIIIICFLLIEFNCTFLISCKKNTKICLLIFYFDQVTFRDGCVLNTLSSVLIIHRPSGLLSFVPALLLSILTPLFLPSSSVSDLSHSCC